MSDYRTIAVDCQGAIQNEALASGEIKPGMLLERTSAAADTVKAHAQDGGFNSRMFAVEDDLQGNGIDDAYATGSRVLFKKVLPGHTVNARIKDGENIAKSDILVADGTGRLKKVLGDSSEITDQVLVAVAREANDRSASSGESSLQALESEFCLVEVL